MRGSFKFVFPPPSAVTPEGGWLGRRGEPRRRRRQLLLFSCMLLRLASAGGTGLWADRRRRSPRIRKARQKVRRERETTWLALGSRPREEKGDAGWAADEEGEKVFHFSLSPPPWFPPPHHSRTMARRRFSTSPPLSPPQEIAGQTNTKRWWDTGELFLLFRVRDSTVFNVHFPIGDKKPRPASSFRCAPSLPHRRRR